MTRIRTVAIIAIILMLMAPTPFFSHFAQAKIDPGGNDGPTPGTPGKPEYYLSGVNVTFAQNDAYETGYLVHEPYEFLAAVWDHQYNQRVTLKLVLSDYEDHHNPNIQYDPSERPRAKLIQYPNWVNGTYGKFIDNKSETNWTYATTWSLNAYNELPFTTYITFDPKDQLDSTKFKPGIFKVEVQIYTRVLGGDYEWKTAAVIWGRFTAGDMNVNDPPTTNPDTKSTYLNVTVLSGKWHIRLYYADLDNGTAADLIKPNGTVMGGNSKLVYDAGYFTSANNPVKLKYTFKDTDPTGAYIWTFTSVYDTSDGEESLWMWSLTVHNDFAQQNSANKEPVVSVEITGTAKINHELTVAISAEDDNSSVIHVWITIYFSSNEYMIPPPWVNTVIVSLYPMDVPNGGTVYKNFTALHAGQLNVAVISRDSQGKMGNITYASIYVEGADTGGAGNLPGLPEWLQFPWESTLNLILLVAGVVLILSSNTKLRLLGILLFFASFINWGYVWQYITTKIHEALPWPLGVLL